MLKISNARKAFGKSIVLNDITLNIDEGMILGLAGPSGSGKSTLLRAIQGLESLDSGTIDYAGTSGFMFQDFQLFPHMTVIRNLMYTPLVVFKQEGCELEAMELLSRLNLTDKANMRPHELSGGQQQRVALARALMRKPHLLLCDEPTSGLDVATISDVVELLRSIQTKDMIMVIASHDLDFLTEIADRVIVLKNGSIVSDILPADVKDPVNALKSFY